MFERDKERYVFLHYLSCLVYNSNRDDYFLQRTRSQFVTKVWRLALDTLFCFFQKVTKKKNGLCTFLCPKPSRHSSCGERADRTDMDATGLKGKAGAATRETIQFCSFFLFFYTAVPIQQHVEITVI